MSVFVHVPLYHNFVLSDGTPVDHRWEHLQGEFIYGDKFPRGIIHRPEEDLEWMVDRAEVEDLTMLLHEGRRPKLDLLSKWKNLHTLSLRIIGDSVSLEGLSHLPTLRKLKLDLSRASGIPGLSFLDPSFHELKELSIVGGHSRILKTLPDHLPVESCRIENMSGNDFSSLAKLKGLKTLDIHQGTTPFDVGFLSTMDGLRFLSFYQSTPLGFRDLESTPYLVSLDPGNTPELNAVCKVNELKGLKELVLSHHSANTPTPDLKPLTMLQNLQELKLDIERGKDLTGVGEIAHLQDLWMNTSMEVPELAPLRNLMGLETLTLTHPPNEITRLELLQDSVKKLFIEHSTLISIKERALLERSLPDTDIIYFDFPVLE